MTEHDLKIWPSWFEEIATGKKAFEVRRNDRNFAPGDTLLLRAWSPTTRTYTGQSLRVAVDFIAFSQFGTPPGIDSGFCVMSIRRLDPLEGWTVDKADDDKLASAEMLALDNIAIFTSRIRDAIGLVREIRREVFIRELRRPKRRRKP